MILVGLRIGWSHLFLAWAFIVISWLTLLFLILYSGGVTSYVLPWLAVLPVLALLFLNFKVSLIWTIISVITMLVFWLGESYLPIQNFFSIPPKAWIVSLSMGLLFLLLIITRIFEKQLSFLLFQVEEQNEGLRATEEELRQNLEELKSIQDVLAMREAESRSIIDTLQKYFLVTEYDTRGKTLRANDKVMTLSGLTTSRDIGKATRDMMDSADWVDFQKNWQTILRGEAVSQEFHIHTKQEEHWINTTFAPISNKDGEVQRVLAVGHEVTLIKKQQQQINAMNMSLRDSLVSLEKQNYALQLKRKEIEQSKVRLVGYTHELMKLTRMPALQAGDFSISLEQILRISTLTLQTSRLSLWRYDETQKVIQCIKVYHQRSNAFDSGVTLHSSDFPIYFDTILKEEIIVADNAREFNATHEFKNNYLIPNAIFSMMDVPLVFDGKFYGIICCEQEDNLREWNAEDITFAKSVADIIVLALSASKRKENELMIVEQNKMIQIQNEGLMKFSEEIKSINKSLEARVRERTEALEKQNMHLSEYAFVNAHLLRGPLCRILGLVELLEFNKGGSDSKQVYEFLRKSTEELDGIVKKITSLLDTGLYFDRKEFINTKSEL